MPRAFITVSVVIAAAMSPASAQTSSRNDPLSRQALRNYAACAVQRSPSGARNLLAMDYRTDDYRQALNRYARGNSRCMSNGELKFGGILLAGGLAEALLPGELHGSTLVARVSKAPVMEALAPRDEQEAVGLCIVRAVPGAVSAVLNATPGTPEETAAFKPTGPAIGDCIAAGKQMTVNKPLLRALYALAAYRLVTDPGVAPAGN